jgi:endogenous inhibitor of DNA gyrase (YacG/DUF329 family)
MKMSSGEKRTAELVCPFCDQKVSKTLYPVIDLVATPARKLGILTDSLFSATCPACGKQFEVEHETLVVDDDARFAILLAPGCLHGGLPCPDDRIGPYALRLTASHDELKEKVLLFDNGLDDRTIELCKLYLSMRLQDDETTLLFTEHRASEGTLAFSVFDREGTQQAGIACDDSLYARLYPKATAFLLPERTFCRVDARWALGQIS